MALPFLKAAAGVAWDFVGDKAKEETLSFAGKHMALLQDVEEDIQKLRKTFSYIKAVLSDAEERRHIDDENVKHWLVQLRASAFHADDVLDRYYTLKAVSELNRSRNDVYDSDSDEFDGDEGLDHQNCSPGKRKRSWFRFREQEMSIKKRMRSSWGFGWFTESLFGPGSYLQRRGFHQEIERIDKRLTEIAEDKKRFRLDKADGWRRGGFRRDSGVGVGTIASYEEGNVIGRDREKNDIVAKLLGGDVALPVIVVHGVAGIGKTSLAKLVCNDVDVGEYFEFRIWVSVLEGWDVRMVVMQIIECLTRKKSDDLSLDLLVNRLTELIRGKRFLLVLDNLVGVDYRFWDDLRVPLIAGAIESKILITTRDENVSRGMETMGKPLRLGGLSESDCWLLLRDKAFPERDWDWFPNLAMIGCQIVSRCQGSPFAAKFLGATLRGKTDEDEWRSILDEMWALKKNNNAVLSSLMVSYHHLDFQQKQCFAYCSLFPRGYEFEKDELVRLWMAERLVVPCNSRRPEAIGNDIFEVLCAKSFLEHPSSEEQKHKMPNLIHDLVRLVAKHETLVVEDNVIVTDEHQSAECKQPRYASLLHRKTDQVAFKIMYQYAHLRAIKVHGESGCLKDVPRDLFSKLKCLRVLDFSNSLVKMLPDSVGQLIHLRYLGLRGTGITKLPKTMCGLYNLQTLELSECSKLQKLPKNIVNLVNVRHICLQLNWDTVKDAKLRSIPCGIGSLPSLETLSRFPVSSKNGCKISELKNLKLRGELCISQLENVLNATDAEEAKLGEKQYIKKLMLQWSNNNSVTTKHTNTSNNIDIAEKLCPHRRLEKLCIENYPGISFPNWLENQSFSFLGSLTLSFCSNLEFFPFVGQLPKLKNLKVEGMDQVVSMGNTIGFTSLETLTLLNMCKLERLFDVDSGTFPMLRELVAKNCPELKKVSNYLQPGRAKVKLSNCPSLLVSDSLLPYWCDLKIETN